MSTTRLIQWIDGELSPAESAHLDEQVAQDPGLAARAEWLRSFLTHRRTAVLEDPPPSLRRTLTTAFRDHQGVHTGELVFDSRSDGVLVRSSGAEGPWSTVHSSIDLDVALDLLPLDGEDDVVIDVSGQIMLGDGRGGDAAEGTTVDWRRAATRGQARCDHLGQFRLGEMEPGEYVVTVHAPSGTMAIDIDLRGPSSA